MAPGRTGRRRLPTEPLRCSGAPTFKTRPASFDKGLALDELMGQPPFSGRRPAVVGDDRAG